MTVTLDIRADIKKLTRDLTVIQKRSVPKVTARAINETLVNARSQAIKEVSSDLRLAQKWVRYRHTIHGEKKGERAVLRKANAGNLVGTMNVYMRGIPVHYIAGKQTKVGVKARGGRLYRSAFKAVSRKTGAELVLKRRGAGTRKLMMPKIGVRTALNERIERYATSASGIATFRRRWERLLQHELNRIGG